MEPEFKNVYKHVVTVPCGLRFAWLRIEDCPVATASVWINGAGINGEGIGVPSFPLGISHLTEHYCAMNYLKTAQARGWGVNAATSEHCVFFQIETPSADWREGTSLLMRAVSSLAPNKRRRLHEIKRTRNEVLYKQGMKPFDFFLSNTIAANFGLPIRTIETEREGYRSTSFADIERFWSSTYRTGSAIVFVSGDMSFEDAGRLCDGTFTIAEGANPDTKLAFRAVDARWKKPKDGALCQIAYPIEASPTYEQSIIKDRFARYVAMTAIENKICAATGLYGIIFGQLITRTMARGSFNFFCEPDEADQVLRHMARAMHEVAQRGAPRLLAEKLKEEEKKQYGGYTSSMDFHRDMLPNISLYDCFSSHADDKPLRLSVTNEDVKCEAQKIQESPIAFFAEGVVKGLPTRKWIMRTFGKTTLDPL